MVDQPFKVRKGIVVANTTASANLDPVTLTIGTSIVNSTAHAAGANIIISTTDVKIGVSAGNVYANSSLLTVTSPSGTANLQSTQLVIGTTIVNSSAVQAGSIQATTVTYSGPLTANGSVGVSGQMLTSNAAGTYWSTPVAATTFATDADVRSATAGNLAIKASELESSSADVSLTDAATIAVDWDTGINFTVTLTTSRILGNPTNGQAGTWRSILLTQPVAGTAVLTFGNQYKFAGGTIPVIGTGASALSRLLIYCRSSTVFECYMAGAGLA